MLLLHNNNPSQYRHHHHRQEEDNHHHNIHHTMHPILLLHSTNSDESYYNNEEDDTAIKRDTLLNNGKQQRPVGAVLRNEFSRIVRTDQIFHSTRKSTRPTKQNQQRDYDCTIVAKPKECQALADRFDLTKLQQLEATLSIRPANSIFGGGGAGFCTQQ